MVPIGLQLVLALSAICTVTGRISKKNDLLHMQSRPIVTGCLDNCGFEDTQCVTECQVCVEHHSCDVITNCKACEEQVLKTRRSALKADVRAVDSGGKSLIHEGLRVKYLNAQMDLEEEEHKLLLARDDVITAQTTADWSSQERSEKSHALRAARQKKVGAQESVHRWSKKNAERLERAKHRLREAEQEAQEEQEKLKAAKTLLRKAHQRVKKAKEEEADEEVLKKAEEQEWVAQRRVEEEKQKVEELQDAVAKRKKEAKWVDKHLKKRVEGKQDDIEVAAKDLKDAQKGEKQAFKLLREKREAYRLQIKRSEAAEDNVERLEKELDEHPLPGQKPPSESKRPALHSAALPSSVSLLALMSLWLA